MSLNAYSSQGEAMDWNNYFHQIRVIPPSDLQDAWRDIHTVIFHGSNATDVNDVEHNLITGYLCNVEPDPATLIPLALGPKKFEGKVSCNDQEVIP